MPTFQRHTAAGTDRIVVEATALIMAGWTGRDPAAVQHHIDELGALGVEPPSAVPLYYPMDPALLAGPVEAIDVVGEATSGEVEAVLLSLADGLWVGLGSDHTDRALEATSVQLSKQLCRKPMAAELWRFDEVIDHWDQMILRAHIREEGQRVLYQEGALATVRRPEDLIQAYGERLGRNDATLPVGTVMFCGALNAIGGIRPASRFEMSLEDPILQRSLSHAYEIHALAEVR